MFGSFDALGHRQRGSTDGIGHVEIFQIIDGWCQRLILERALMLLEKFDVLLEIISLFDRIQSNQIRCHFFDTIANTIDIVVAKRGATDLLRTGSGR